MTEQGGARRPLSARPGAWLGANAGRPAAEPVEPVEVADVDLDDAVPGPDEVEAVAGIPAPAVGEAVSTAPGILDGITTAVGAPAAERPELPEPAEPVGHVVPLGVPAAPATGVDSVDRALASLPAVDGLPTDRHGPVYEDVHRGLRDALAALDS